TLRTRVALPTCRRAFPGLSAETPSRSSRAVRRAREPRIEHGEVRAGGGHSCATDFHSLRTAAIAPAAHDPPGGRRERADMRTGGRVIPGGVTPSEPTRLPRRKRR